MTVITTRSATTQCGLHIVQLVKALDDLVGAGMSPDSLLVIAGDGTQFTVQAHMTLPSPTQPALKLVPK